MSKKKPVCSVEKTLAGIAKSVHELREEGDSTDRIVGVLTRGVAALTTRVEALETKVGDLSLELAALRQRPRTWLQFIRGE